MSRYIDADVLKEKLRYSMLFKMGFINHCADAGQEIPKEERKQIMDSIDLHEAFIKLIDEQSTIEPQSEQKMGRWIYDGDCYICNQCKSAFNWWADSQTSNFCPNCGAKMEEGN